MTQAQFDLFRKQVMAYYADLAWKYVLKCNIGTKLDKIDNDLYTLTLVRGYIDILLEYTLFYANEEDTNFFTKDEMKFIVMKINDIFNTNFDISFVKT